MSGELPDELMDIESELFDEDETEETPEVETERVIIFRLGGQSYAVPVMEVTQVVETTSRTRVPRTSPAIDGIIDLRGEITAVVNPWVHLDLPGDPGEWERQLVVVFVAGEDEQQTGIRIDEIVGVEAFPVTQIDREIDAHTEGPNPGNPIVEAMIHREDGSEHIAMLDIDAIIAASSQHPEAVSRQ